ncbi:uncharacterized protein Fot_46359 [Forsythia ovata]|uniref:Uncharacterized protein n=1 Tax=Forsythia ovata TaxID=205694 RepID=A0ABD1QM93_9LAMI
MKCSVTYVMEKIRHEQQENGLAWFAFQISHIHRKGFFLPLFSAPRRRPPSSSPFIRPSTFLLFQSQDLGGAGVRAVTDASAQHGGWRSADISLGNQCSSLLRAVPRYLKHLGGPAHQVLEDLRSLHVGLFDGNILFGQEKIRVVVHYYVFMDET